MFRGHTHCAYYREGCATGFTRQAWASFDSCRSLALATKWVDRHFCSWLHNIHSTKKRHDTIKCSSWAYTLRQLSQKLCRGTCEKQRGLALTLFPKKKMGRSAFLFPVASADTLFIGHTHCAYYQEDCATGFTREGCASFDSCSFGHETSRLALQFVDTFSIFTRRKYSKMHFENPSTETVFASHMPSLQTLHFFNRCIQRIE
jgi:UDP-2,3-diacylglucosamine pyrophosphatase LpxH